MKRLLKKADSEVNFVQEFFNAWDSSWNNQDTQTMVDKVIAENSDCLYNGTGYRFLRIEEHDFEYEEMDANQILEAAQQKIGVENRYCSWTQDLKSMQIYIRDVHRGDIGFSDGVNGVVIKNNISGLSVERLYNKYAGKYVDEEMEWLGEMLASYKEIIAMDSGGFEFIGYMTNAGGKITKF